MNTRSLVSILLGTALAGGASYLVMTFSDTGDGAAQANQVPMQEVVVANTEIGAGAVIEPTMLATQAWPREAVPAGVFIDMKAFAVADAPRRALSTIFPGELMLAAKVSQPGATVSLVQKITPGYRAMAIRVSAETAVGGFVTPGDYVDILMIQGGGPEMRAVTVLQNVRVIGIDQIAEKLQDQPVVARTITVEVMPVDGQKLALAQQAGQLSLTLRDLDAPAAEELPEIGLSDLFAPEPEPVVEEPPEPEPEPVDIRPRVTVRRGIEEEEVVVE